MKNLFQNPFKNKWDIIDGMMVLVLSTSMAVISYRLFVPTYWPSGISYSRMRAVA